MTILSRWSKRSRRWFLLAATLALVASAVTATQAVGGSMDSPGDSTDSPGSAEGEGAPGSAKGLGQLSGLLPRENLTLGSAIQVDLSKQTVRLPLYRGVAYGKTVWFVLLDSSDAGAAHDLGLNYAPKLANLGIGCDACVQTVTLDAPATPAQNRFGQAVVNFQGA